MSGFLGFTCCRGGNALVKSPLAGAGYGGGCADFADGGRGSQQTALVQGLALLFALLVSFSSFAAGVTDELQTGQKDLSKIRQRIEALQDAIGKTEVIRSAEEQERQQAERAVSQAQRRLRQLQQQHLEHKQELERLKKVQAILQTEIERKRSELGHWLRRYYMQGSSDVPSMLSGREPNQLARDLHYLERLGQVRLELVQALREDLAEQAKLTEAVAARLAELGAFEQQQKSLQAELRKDLRRRTQAVSKLAKSLQGQQREVETLQRDERRLKAVLQKIEQRAREQREQAPEPESDLQTSAPESTRRLPPRPTAVLGQKFAQLRGGMSLPAQGELIRRFGTQRVGGGTTWRGVFIRARSGQDVMAVAAGEVVFADWLRGYGNLIIIDHGDDYLTVYANNDALFREVGERLGRGDVIASVGTSGDEDETGLYFEIRHRGEAVNPSSWIGEK